jgi:hypothetical protein
MHLLGYDFGLQASKQMGQSWLSETAISVVGNQTKYTPYDPGPPTPGLREQKKKKKATGYQRRPVLLAAVSAHPRASRWMNLSLCQSAISPSQQQHKLAIHPLRPSSQKSEVRTPSSMIPHVRLVTCCKPRLEISRAERAPTSPESPCTHACNKHSSRLLTGRIAARSIGS